MIFCHPSSTEIPTHHCWLPIWQQCLFYHQYHCHPRRAPVYHRYHYWQTPVSLLVCGINDVTCYFRYNLYSSNIPSPPTLSVPQIFSYTSASSYPRTSSCVTVPSLPLPQHSTSSNYIPIFSVPPSTPPSGFLFPASRSSFMIWDLSFVSGLPRWSSYILQLPVTSQIQVDVYPRHILIQFLTDPTGSPPQQLSLPPSIVTQVPQPQLILILCTTQTIIWISNELIFSFRWH